MKSDNDLKVLYITLKSILGAFALMVMYFASRVWIGSKEEWDEQVNNNLLGFGGSRMIFTFLVGLVFFGISMGLNWLFRSNIRYGRKQIILELVAILLVSFVMVITAICYN